jgi:RNA polymerase sigma-70 factor (ECF subfamily)
MAKSSSGSVGSTSSTLLERVKTHDEAAWRRLVHLYGGLVRYWCKKSGLQDADLDDVFQEVFRSVSSHIADYRHERLGDTFRGWLRTVTRNKILDHFRSRGREVAGTGGTEAYQRLCEEADSTDSLEIEMGLVMKQAIEIVQAEFEPQTWRAFWRTVVDNVPTSAVAEELEMSTAGVRQAKSRVQRRMHQEMEGVSS